MSKTLDHIGIAVRRLEDGIKLYTEILGGTLIDRFSNEEVGVETHIAVIDLKGERIELLEPTSKTSPIARFMKQKGKGIHHIAYRVEDLEKTIEEMKERGIKFLDDTYRVTSRGRRLIYMNPIETEGTIIELCDYPKGNS